MRSDALVDAVRAGASRRGWLLAGWATGVVGVLVLNVAWPLPGHADEWPWVVGLMAFPVAAAVVLSQRPRDRPPADPV